MPSKKLNILFISHLSGSGGAERCLFDVVSRINREKFNVYINTPYDDELNHKLKQNNISYTISFTDQWIPLSQNWGIDHLFKFVKLLRARIWSIETKINNLSIDLVYSNSITCIDGAIAAKRMGVPHIWHIHENVDGNRSLKSYLPIGLTYRIARFFCTHFIVVSKTVARHINEPGINVYTIFNGADFKKFSIKKTNSLKNELCLAETTKIIAQIGSLIPVKRVEVFVEAAETVLSSKSNKELAFILVGSGEDEYTEVIKNKIANSPFSHHFFLLGQRQNIPEIMNEIDILAITSESEGFSRVAIEAMAAGKPVVATRCGGPEEIILDHETGFLVPVGDAKAIAERLILLIDNSGLASQMGKEGRQRVKEHFSMDKYISSIEKVIIGAVENLDPRSL
jgi:glycosyltransferase involved in cell wall biosynthesis